ncbi:hypothetical protein [Bifidobacterium moukalabense]|uniref:hypothetical protein n=1 Tax=Bifidobacterium moukalabense TaxID=1333651 RepID=UPI00201E6575|nr:hypothetical protein [Bifidobacterium moukalabense]
MDDRTGGTWPAGKSDAVPKAPSPCPGPLSGRPKTMPVPDLPEGWGGFSGAKVNVDIRTTIAHPDCHSKNSPGEALRPCYTVISRKTADTSRATVHHTTLETACKPALALGMHAEDLLENDARESIDKWHGPAIPGIQEQHERDRRPDGIGPKGCRASSPFGSGDMEFKPLEPFEPFDWNNEEEDETEKDIKGKKKGKGSDGMGLRTPMPSEPLPFYVPSSQSLPMRLYLASADPPACERTAPSAHRI